VGAGLDSEASGAESYNIYAPKKIYIKIPNKLYFKKPYNLNNSYSFAEFKP